MKTIKFSVTMKVTEEYYKNDLDELKKEVLSGVHQKDMLRDGRDKGLISYDATFEILESSSTGEES